MKALMRAEMDPTFATLAGSQIYENYARSSVDGLSPIFLLQWMGGDVTNL